MEQNIKVSVIVICYNHRNYIRQCIESILAQKTDFKFEIIVHDDASDDGSLHIINQLKRKFDDNIYIYKEHSPVYLKHGAEILYEKLIKNAKGKYLAFCEGDDYWCDKSKLQRQYDKMEQYGECGICVHPVKLYDCMNKKNIGVIPNNRKFQGTNIIKNTDIVYKWIREGAFFAANAFFVRKSCLQDVAPEFVRRTCMLDFTMFLEVLATADVLFLPEPMAYKRVYNINSMSLQNQSKDKKKKLKNLKDISVILQLYDEYSKYHYHREIENVVLFEKIKANLIENNSFEEVEKLDFSTGRVIGRNTRYLYAVKNKISDVLCQIKIFYSMDLMCTRFFLSRRLDS